ncbi:MAG: PASTA domain-containing protein [bacterium]|nr:PASTA domain-containing protein [bacterium]
MDKNIHLAERKERRGRRLTSLAFIAVVALLGASLFGLFTFLEADAAFGTIEDLEERWLCDPDQFVLEFPAVGSLSELYTEDGVLLGKLSERNSQPISLDDIPETVINAILAAEDAEFYEHDGIDYTAIARAAIEIYQGGNLQGGSTITQQVVKQNFLSSEQTLERKICEAVIAAELENRYTKDQILEFYLNSMFFGQNAYGIQAAAQEYWGKDLKDVTIAEATAMATPLRNPSLYNLRTRPETVIRARNAAIRQMEVNGFITSREAVAAMAEPLAPVEHEEFDQLSPEVIIAAREEILSSPAYGLGDTYTQRKRALFGCPADDTNCAGGGGLKVTVTVNHELQTEANRILRAWFQDLDGPTGAIAMVENGTGAVRVMSSGLDFGNDIEAGQRPYDLATKGRRQAGSSFKPFALVTALERGSKSGLQITLASYFDQTSPQKIDCGVPCSPQGNIWTVRNAGSGGSGLRTLEQATYFSTNTVYAQVSVAVGPENIADTAHRMGIESPLNAVPSIALGTQSVSPLEMASAYSTLANYGERVESYLIEKIEDAAGNVVYQHEVERTRVLDEALTAAVVKTMEKVVSQGTATRANIGRPQAGKTGTAQNFRDVWFMGYIPQYTTAVWVGHADAQVEMVNFKVWDDLNQRTQSYQRAFGGTLAAPIWKQFMLYATQDLPIVDFPPDPDGVGNYYKVPITEVPDVTGMTEAEARRAILHAGLNPSIIEVSSDSPVGTILSQSPSPGTEIRQGASVTVRVSTGEAATIPAHWIGAPASSIENRIERFNSRTGLNVTYRIVERVDEDNIGRIITIRPGPGETVKPGRVIVFVVGVAP